MRSHRAKTLLDSVLSRSYGRSLGDRLARNVTISFDPTEPTIDVDFAYINGKLTVGQAIDLNVQPSVQEKNSDHAIATVTDIRLKLERAEVACVNVAAIGAGSDSRIIRRLESYGPLIKLPDDQDRLGRLLRDDAQHDVAGYFEEMGFHINRATESLQIVSTPRFAIEGSSQLSFPKTM